MRSRGQTGRMDSPSIRDTTVGDWMRALAEPVGDPGGGAAVGVQLAIAAGLLSMVAAYSDAPDATDRARELQRRALAGADADAEVSDALGTAVREDGDVASASLDAAGSSARLGDLACGAVDDLAWLAEHGKRFLVADVAVAAGALRAALTGARANLAFDLDEARSADGPDPEPGPLDGAADRIDAAVRRVDEIVAALAQRAR